MRARTNTPKGDVTGFFLAFFGFLYKLFFVSVLFWALAFVGLAAAHAHIHTHRERKVFVSPGLGFGGLRGLFTANTQTHTPHKIGDHLDSGGPALHTLHALTRRWSPPPPFAAPRS